MGILEKRFISKVSTLSETEKYVFYRIDKHPSLIKKLTLTQLAEEFSTSNTTIIRMSKKLGLEGFSQFKYIVNQLVSDTKTFSQDVLITNYQHYLNDVFRPENIKKIEELARKIHKASTLYIVGVGLTKPIGEYIAKRFLQLNKPTLYSYEHHLIELIPTLTKQNDVIIFLSVSGETNSILHAAKKIKYSDHVALYSITNSGNSSLEKLMDVSISSDIPSNTYENYDITSRAFLMVQADLIIEMYLNIFFK